MREVADSRATMPHVRPEYPHQVASRRRFCTCGDSSAADPPDASRDVPAAREHSYCRYCGLLCSSEGAQHIESRTYDDTDMENSEVCPEEVIPSGREVDTVDGLYDVDCRLAPVVSRCAGQGERWSQERRAGPHGRFGASVARVPICRRPLPRDSHESRKWKTPNSTRYQCRRLLVAEVDVSRPYSCPDRHHRAHPAIGACTEYYGDDALSIPSSRRQEGGATMLRASRVPKRGGGVVSEAAIEAWAAAETWARTVAAATAAVTMGIEGSITGSMNKRYHGEESDMRTSRSTESSERKHCCDLASSCGSGPGSTSSSEEHSSNIGRDCPSPIYKRDGVLSGPRARGEGIGELICGCYPHESRFTKARERTLVAASKSVQSSAARKDHPLHSEKQVPQEPSDDVDTMVVKGAAAAIVLARIDLGERAWRKHMQEAGLVGFNAHLTWVRQQKERGQKAVRHRAMTHLDRVFGVLRGRTKREEDARESAAAVVAAAAAVATSFARTHRIRSALVMLQRNWRVRAALQSRHDLADLHFAEWRIPDAVQAWRDRSRAKKSCRAAGMLAVRTWRLKSLQEALTQWVRRSLGDAERRRKLLVWRSALSLPLQIASGTAHADPPVADGHQVRNGSGGDLMHNAHDPGCCSAQETQVSAEKKAVMYSRSFSPASQSSLPPALISDQAVRSMASVARDTSKRRDRALSCGILRGDETTAKTPTPSGARGTLAASPLIVGRPLESSVGTQGPGKCRNEQPHLTSAHSVPGELQRGFDHTHGSTPGIVAGDGYGTKGETTPSTLSAAQASPVRIVTSGRGGSSERGYSDVEGSAVTSLGTTNVRTVRVHGCNSAGSDRASLRSKDSTTPSPARSAEGQPELSPSTLAAKTEECRALLQRAESVQVPVSCVAPSAANTSSLEREADAGDTNCVEGTADSVERVEASSTDGGSGSFVSTRADPATISEHVHDQAEVFPAAGKTNAPHGNAKLGISPARDEEYLAITRKDSTVRGQSVRNMCSAASIPRSSKKKRRGRVRVEFGWTNRVDVTRGREIGSDFAQEALGMKSPGSACLAVSQEIAVPAGAHDDFSQVKGVVSGVDLLAEGEREMDPGAGECDGDKERSWESSCAPLSSGVLSARDACSHPLPMEEGLMLKSEKNPVNVQRRGRSDVEGRTTGGVGSPHAVDVPPVPIRPSYQVGESSAIHTAERQDTASRPSSWEQSDSSLAREYQRSFTRQIERHRTCSPGSATSSAKILGHVRCQDDLSDDRVPTVAARSDHPAQRSDLHPSSVLSSAVSDASRASAMNITHAMKLGSTPPFDATFASSSVRPEQQQQQEGNEERSVDDLSSSVPTRESNSEEDVSGESAHQCAVPLLVPLSMFTRPPSSEISSVSWSAQGQTNGTAQDAICGRGPDDGSPERGVSMKDQSKCPSTLSDLISLTRDRPRGGATAAALATSAKRTDVHPTVPEQSDDTSRPSCHGNWEQALEDTAAPSQLFESARKRPHTTDRYVPTCSRESGQRPASEPVARVSSGSNSSRRRHHDRINVDKRSSQGLSARSVKARGGAGECTTVDGIDVPVDPDSAVQAMTATATRNGADPHHSSSSSGSGSRSDGRMSVDAGDIGGNIYGDILRHSNILRPIATNEGSTDESVGLIEERKRGFDMSTMNNVAAPPTLASCAARGSRGSSRGTVNSVHGVTVSSFAGSSSRVGPTTHARTGLKVQTSILGPELEAWTDMLAAHSSGNEVPVREEDREGGGSGKTDGDTTSACERRPGPGVCQSEIWSKRSTVSSVSRTASSRTCGSSGNRRTVEGRLSEAFLRRRSLALGVREWHLWVIASNTRRCWARPLVALASTFTLRSSLRKWRAAHAARKAYRKAAAARQSFFNAAPTLRVPESPLHVPAASQHAAVAIVILRRWHRRSVATLLLRRTFLAWTMRTRRFRAVDDYGRHALMKRGLLAWRQAAHTADQARGRAGAIALSITEFTARGLLRAWRERRRRHADALRCVAGMQKANKAASLGDTRQRPWRRCERSRIKRAFSAWIAVRADRGASRAADRAATTGARQRLCRGAIEAWRLFADEKRCEASCWTKGERYCRLRLSSGGFLELRRWAQSARSFRDTVNAAVVHRRRRGAALIVEHLWHLMDARRRVVNRINTLLLRTAARAGLDRWRRATVDGRMSHTARVKTDTWLRKRRQEAGVNGFARVAVRRLEERRLMRTALLHGWRRRVLAAIKLWRVWTQRRIACADLYAAAAALHVARLRSLGMRALDRVARARTKRREAACIARCHRMRTFGLGRWRAATASRKHAGFQSKIATLHWATALTAKVLLSWESAALRQWAGARQEEAAAQHERLACKRRGLRAWKAFCWRSPRRLDSDVSARGGGATRCCDFC